MVFSTAIGQTQLEGMVVDHQTGEPLVGVAVYISGSSLGVVTELDGTFSLKYPKKFTAPLTIRLLGYQTREIKDPVNQDLSIVKLEVKPDELDAVVLGLDPWSRKKKEAYFKKYFLGTAVVSKDLKIKNLDKVRLRFNPVYATLTAVCDEPIIVENRYLGYSIEVDMSDFEAQFTKISNQMRDELAARSSRQIPQYVYYSSHMVVDLFFKESEKSRPTQRKRKKNRNKLYRESEIALMKSIINESLEEDGYFLILNRKKVVPEKHIRVRPFKENIYQVEFRELEYQIADMDGEDSLIVLLDHKILVSHQGNIVSSRVLLTGGYLGSLKLSGMLPLDFVPEKD